MTRAFLRAEWRNLVMLNYVVEPALLEPFVPKDTQLDAWRGRTYVSLVGFMFVDTRVLGVPIPFHRNFEEINLRPGILQVKPICENCADSLRQIAGCDHEFVLMAEI